jgi:hypothetical protein
MQTIREIPTTERVIVSTQCDVCKKVFKGSGWESKTNETLATFLSISEGYHDQDGYSGTNISVDICPDCFKNVLIPFLNGIGVAIEKTAI